MRRQRFVSLLCCFLFVSSLCSSSAFAVILGGDYTRDDSYIVIVDEEIDTREYTFTVSKATAIIIRSTGRVSLKGKAVQSKRGSGIQVESGGVLFIDDPVSVSGSTYALDISSGAEVHLSSGTYFGKSAAIRVAGGDFGSLLEAGYGYFDADDNPIPLANVGTAKTVVVKQSAEHLEHTWEETERTPSDCRVNGSIKYTCSECGETKTEELPLSSEHTWNEIDRTEPTFTSEGSITYECSVCSATKSESIPKLEECSHTWIETGRTEPTFTSEGSITYECSICGAIKSENIPKLEECPHTWEETGRIEPTTTRPGSIIYTCSQCGETKTESIPALPPAPLDPDSISFINWLGSTVGLFNMTLNCIMEFPALRLFAGVLVFLMMFGLLARLLKQGRKGRL